MKLVELSEQQIWDAQAMSHELWSGGKSLEERVAGIKALCETYSELLSYQGLVDSDGRVLCSAKLYACEIHVRGNRQRCLGLGAIFSKPETRGQGIAARLVDECVSNACERGFGGAFLWSDIGTAYYEKLGFEPLELKKHFYSVESGAPYLHFSRAGHRDLQFQRELYHASIRDLELAPLRSERSWRLYREKNQADDYIVKDREGAPIGYFSASPHGEFLWMDEACSHAHHRQEVWGAVCALAHSKGSSEIRAWSQPFGIALAPLRSIAVEKGIPMLKLFDGSSVREMAGERFFLGSLDYF